MISFMRLQLWNTFHRADLVPVCVKKTLEDLRVAYLDLYLIHWPMGYQEDGELFPKDADGKFIFSKVDYVDTWKGMEECVRLGLVKSIGLSNFNHKQIDRILSNCSIKPAVLQVISSRLVCMQLYMIITHVILTLFHRLSAIHT